ncbi:MFS transporter, partial [Aeromonas salmonicida]|uniref:MFS transporter n=1 Tax=Aeromonas salmonicida TaxID=645 RepID=UPI003905D9A9
ALRRGSSLAALYITTALLVIGMTSEIFVPYFLQLLHGQSPLISGYIAAAMAAGWTLSEILSSGWRGAGIRRAIVSGPLFVLVGLLAPALSPALGGWLVDRLDWRWVFFANLPLAAVALALAALWLRAETSTAMRKPLDGKGLLSACAGLTLLLLGLTRLSEAGHQ